MSKLENSFVPNQIATNSYDGDLKVTLVEPSGTSSPANTEVDSTQPFDIVVDWDQKGTMVPGMYSAGATWDLEVLYEQRGTPIHNAGSLAPALNPAVSPVPGHKYTETFNIPAGALPLGIYNIYVTLGFTSVTGARVNAFEELSPLRVY